MGVVGERVVADAGELGQLAASLAEVSTVVTDAASTVRGASGFAAAVGVVGGEFAAMFGGAVAAYADTVTSLAVTYRSASDAVTTAARSYVEGDAAAQDLLVVAGRS